MKKSVLPLLMICSLTLTSVALPAIASADEVDSKIQQKDQAISGLKAKEADAQSQVAAVQSEVAGINEKAEALLAEQGILRETSTKLTNEISQLTKRIEKREVAIKNQARDVQVNGSTTYMDALLNAKSFSDAITRVTAMNTIVNANNDLVKQQQEDKKSVESKKAENEEKMKAIEENQVTLEAQKGELVKAEAELNVLQTTLAAERATAEDQKAGLVKEKEAAIAERARIAEQEKVVAENARKAKAEEAAAKATASEKPANTTNTESGATTPSNNNGGGGNVTPTPTPTPVVPGDDQQKQPDPDPIPEPTGGSAISIAAAQVGKPYVWGSKGPNSFDCSGLVYYAFMQSTGRNVGGYTVSQESAGVRISVAEAQAGDLYFWGSPGASYHVAIATGGGGYIHAGNPSTGVEYSNVGAFTPSFAVRM
ncbi:coiled-coil domain-containing protein [Candidatus Enterococcus mansonii]|uniref:NlpC/P60 domain-containing protein n=1 Tax=Candidatus Enterococcus mansonii TaxID=1834181 RepID=A0A242CEX8_9ENTE|nr:C40 family peptidase [Enterococcus sp. 4G2_DIV0659]OTO08719.1 hypothetical protein A5880_001719 [Enterococcus sp. 4G2_DIV0659]